MNYKTKIAICILILLKQSSEHLLDYEFNWLVYCSTVRICTFLLFSAIDVLLKMGCSRKFEKSNLTNVISLGHIDGLAKRGGGGVRWEMIFATFSEKWMLYLRECDICDRDVWEISVWTLQNACIKKCLVKLKSIMHSKMINILWRYIRMIYKY